MFLCHTFSKAIKVLQGQVKVLPSKLVIFSSSMSCHWTAINTTNNKFTDKCQWQFNVCFFLNSAHIIILLNQIRRERSCSESAYWVEHVAPVQYMCSKPSQCKPLLLLWPFYGPESGRPVTRRNIHSPTHLSYPDHHPIIISFFHLLRSIASSLFNLRAWQSFCTTSLQDLFGLPLGLEPSSITMQTADINEHMTEVLRLTRVTELAIRRGKDSEPLQPQPYIICNSGNGMCI